MGDPARPQPSTSSPHDGAPPPPPPPPPFQPLTLLQPPPNKKRSSRARVFRVFRNVIRSFPIISSPVCKLPSLPGGGLSPDGRTGGGPRITGTLFGYRKGRACLSIQENPRTLPMLVLELAIQTHVLQKELSLGMVRIAMECEKRADRPDKEKGKLLLEEPLWTMFCNGKKGGYAARREATEEDLKVMEVLRPVSMGTGVLPPEMMEAEAEGPDGEMAYIRAYFERVVGSKDSETLYMLSPDQNNGPDLSIFFVRI